MVQVRHFILTRSLALAMSWVSTACLEAASPGSKPLAIPSLAELTSSSVVWQWTLPENSWSSPCALVEDHLLCPVMRQVPEGEACSLVVLDPQTGRIKWQADLGRGSVERWDLAVFANSVVLVSTGNHLFALALKDGSLFWEKALRCGRVFPVAGGALVHQWSSAGAPEKLLLLDPLSGAQRCSRPLEYFVNWLEPWDGDILVMSFGFEEAMPPVLPFAVRVGGEDLRTLWRLELPKLKNAVRLHSALWLHLQDQEQGGWYQLQRDGSLVLLTELANWKGSLLWVGGEYQLWNKDGGKQLCRWRSETNSWAWCRDLPKGKWLAQQLERGQLALAGSTETQDLLSVLNDDGEVVFQTLGIPEPEALYHFQGQWLWQQQRRILLTRADKGPSLASQGVKAQATQLLEQAAAIPAFGDLAIPRVAHLVKALLALGPEVKPVLEAKLSSSGTVGFAAGLAVLVRWGDESAAARLVHWLDQDLNPTLSRNEMLYDWALDVATAAIQSMGCDAPAVRPLAQLMEANNLPWRIRFSAFSNLAQCGLPQAFAALQRQLQGQVGPGSSPWLPPPRSDLLVRSTLTFHWNSQELVLYEEGPMSIAPGLWLALLAQGQVTSSWFTGFGGFDPSTEELSFEATAEGFRLVRRRKALSAAEAALPPEAREIRTVTWEEIQRDQDGDGLTDLLETRLGLAKDRVDSDRDGIEDALDWCPNCGQAPTGPEDEAAKAFLYQFAHFLYEQEANLARELVVWVRPLEFSHPFQPVFLLVKGSEEQARLLAGPMDGDLMDALWLRPLNPAQLPKGWPADLVPGPGEVALDVSSGFLGIAAIVGRAADGRWYVLRWRVTSSGC